MIDIEELKRLARAATPGPWKYNGDITNDIGGKFDEIEAANGQIVSGEYGGPRDEEAEYIAAANPSVILELIERVRKLETALAYAIKEADGWFDDSRGGQIDEPEMDAARALLVK